MIEIGLVDIHDGTLSCQKRVGWVGWGEKALNRNTKKGGKVGHESDSSRNVNDEVKLHTKTKKYTKRTRETIKNKLEATPP